MLENFFIKELLIMKNLTFLLLIVFFILSSSAEGGNKNITLKIDDLIYSVEWENNESVNALKEISKDGKIIDMHRYSNFEQVGNIGQTLPRNDKYITTSPGDIVLYSGNQIVIFFGSNSWEYTKLGRITGKTESEIKKALNKNNVTLKFN